MALLRGAACTRHDEQVCAIGGNFGALDADLLHQVVTALVDPGSVQQRYRHAVHGHHRLNNVTRGARLRRHNRALAAAPSIQQA
jgi:hypothetical protein